MAHLEFALLDERADRLRQVEQAQQVRHRRARAADGLRSLLVRELEFADQARERERLLERVQVLALDVLDEGERDGVLVVDAPQHRRDLVQARHLRGAPAALAGDDLVALRLARRRRADRAHDDRLDDALGLDRVREVRERFLAHVHARLVLAARQEVHGDLQELLARRRRARLRPRLGFAEQRLEPAPQPAFLVAHGRQCSEGDVRKGDVHLFTEYRGRLRRSP